MTPREAVALARYVKACCPQQAIDEYTPDAWHDLLGDLGFDDCREAVRAVAQRQPFVSPSEIREEVRRIRGERIGPAGPGLSPIPPPADPDDPQAYIAALRAQRARIAAGVEEVPALEAGGQTGYDDNPHVEAIRERFDAEQRAARTRMASERRAESDALAAYRDAVEVLLHLDDHGTDVFAQAREDLLGEEQAAQGFPLRETSPGVTDEHKVTIRAAWLAQQGEPCAPTAD